MPYRPARTSSSSPANPHQPKKPNTSNRRSRRRPAASGAAPTRSSSGRSPSPRSSSGYSSSRSPSAAATLAAALDAAAAAPAPADREFAQFGLPEALVTALQRHGMQRPFAVQTRVLPDALAGRDILGRAQTGSGKTLAFGLPVLSRLAAADARRVPSAPRSLVLVPTRELARQVADALRPLAEALRLRVTTVVGGLSMATQIDHLRRGVDVLVATPGRLIDLVERDCADLGRVQITVLDEADHMADLGFLPAVRRILDATPASAQRMLLSATLDGGVAELVTAYLHDPACHAVAPAVDAATAMEHRVFTLEHADRVAVAQQIAGRPARTLFFVRTKHGADRLARQLSRSGADAAAIHGNLNQNQRQRALDSFASGRARVLVATDVAARGIHVDDVDLVVHFDLPADHKDYLHRSGRTARAGATGMVVAFADPSQQRVVSQLHRDAEVSASHHRVHPGHAAVAELAASGEPVVVTEAPSRPQPAPKSAPKSGQRRRPRARR